MKASGWSSHALAVGIGIALAALVSPRSDDRARGETAASGQLPPHRRLNSGRTRVPPGNHHDLWVELARSPMESGLRERVKAGLLKDWAARDPKGLVLWVEKNPWVEGSAWDTWSAWEEISRTDPEWLLGYARRTGSELAFRTFAGNGDPHLALRLLLADGEERIPPGMIARLFGHGCETDPDYHKNLSVLQDPALRAVAAEAALDSLMDAKRPQEVLRWLLEDGDHLPAEELGARLGQAFARLQSGLDWLVGLPPGVREAAAESVMRTIHNETHPSFAAETLETLQAEGLLNGREEIVSEVFKRDFRNVLGYDLNDADKQLAEQWKSWSQGLPATNEYQHLRNGALRSWIQWNPREWREINKLVEPESRDIFHASAAVRLRGVEAVEARGQISDPELREQVKGYQEWDQDPEDPFASYDGPEPWLRWASHAGNPATQNPWPLYPNPVISRTN